MYTASVHRDGLGQNFNLFNSIKASNCNFSHDCNFRLENEIGWSTLSENILVYTHKYIFDAFSNIYRYLHFLYIYYIYEIYIDIYIHHHMLAKMNSYINCSNFVTPFLCFYLRFFVMKMMWILRQIDHIHFYPS